MCAQLPVLSLAHGPSGQVKNAYAKLMDENQKKAILMNIEHVEKEVVRERKKLVSKGVRLLLHRHGWRVHCCCVVAGESIAAAERGVAATNDAALRR